ncbi:MAG: prolyl oligopeptidase family serine peptidase [Bacteroidetes bacterium]|nr:prolyl oligopeptidase family serine peptidase [Bacteroidota bacterium]
MKSQLFALSVLLLIVTSNQLSAVAQMQYQPPPEPLDQLLDAPATPNVSLSPDRQMIALLHRPGMPSIGDVSAPEKRLAGLRINSRIHGQSRASKYSKITLKSLESDDQCSVSGIPESGGIRNVAWAPGGAHLSFTVDMDDRVDLYVVEVASCIAKKLARIAVNDVVSGSIRWNPDSQSLLARSIPENHSPMPIEPLAPKGPVILENLGEEAAARTYQDLLTNPYDEELFAWFLQSQLLEITLDGLVNQLGKQGLALTPMPSPDGNYILVREILEPFSYLVPASRFSHRYTVYDSQGQFVREIAELPLAENVPVAFGSTIMGPRSMAWRADAPATLVWVEALDGGDGGIEAQWRDEILLLDAPFDSNPISLTKLQLRYSGVLWGTDSIALVMETWWSTRQTKTSLVNPSSPGEIVQVIFDRSTEDRYGNPGSFQRIRSDQGTLVLRMRENQLFLIGTGASEQGDRPFLKNYDITTGETTTLFQSESPHYERPVTFIDESNILTIQESVDSPPNYYVRNLDDRSLRAVTDFEHPYPELVKMVKEDLIYSRSDDVPLKSTLYLPPGYDVERDGPLPTLIWAYPREFKNAAYAGQRTGSPYRFKFMSYSGAIPYVTQGYAVLDATSMPVIGEGENEPNDTFRGQLVANAQAAINAGVERGVVDANRVAIGGHSYGAFMTANLLAHSDLFRAGIARSGAYNRTLTPFGFQREERLFWESPETYYSMSPFMHADKVNEPILLIHGEADNNSGTFPIQSQRFYGALKGLGKTARLVMLPNESHGYRARESVGHVLWETTRWLDTYVKNSDVPTRSEPELSPEM